MSKLAPELTEYGQAAQELELTWDRQYIPEEIQSYDLACSIEAVVKLLNQRHLEILAEQAETPRDDDMIEAAAAELFEHNYPDTMWDQAFWAMTGDELSDWTRYIYRKQARQLLTKLGLLKGDK